ncbi:MAG: prolipoprotein diacylglyceryl transferase [Acidobacteria bacterium]|nr:prolipoprotein diacylglyceryl transferase [Acidobacteriota bacterium]
MQPTLGHLFGLEIHTYGAAVSLALVVGVTLALWLRPRDTLSAGDVLNLSLIGLGAYVATPALAFLAGALHAGRVPSEGHFSFVPTALLAAAGFAVYARVRSIPPVPALDVLVPILAVCFGVVRCLGCYLAGCCHGAPTTLPWGVVFPPGSPAHALYPGTPVHPAQLYLGLSALAVGALALAPPVRRRAAPGVAAGAALGTTAAVYLIVTFHRGDIPPDRLPWLRGGAAFLALAALALPLAGRKAGLRPVPPTPSTRRKK